MFIPMPALIAIAVAMLLLVGLALRASRARDPLMGGQAPASRAPLAGSTVSGAAATALPPGIEEQIRALIAAGRKIEAIKLAREATHSGLSEAKDLVESME
jgi:ribosomal protein L7/L12